MSARMFLCDCGLEVQAYEQARGGLNIPPGRDPVWDAHIPFHRARHRRYRVKGVTPAPAESRATYARWATEMLAPGRNLATQHEGAEERITWGYNESLAANADSEAYLDHPSRDRYAAQLDLERLFPEEIARRLRRQYGPPGLGPLIGESGVWHPSAGARAA